MSINSAEILATCLQKMLKSNPDWQPDYTASPVIVSAFGRLIQGDSIGKVIQTIIIEDERQSIPDNTLRSPPI